MMNGKENSISRYISILYRFRKGYVNKRLESYGISGVQFSILLTLSRQDGVSQEKISDHLKFDKTTTAKTIKKLEANGYVQREIDRTDRRAYNVYLTQKAKDLIPLIRETIRHWESAVTENISDEEYALLESILERMANSSFSMNKRDESAPSGLGGPA